MVNIMSASITNSSHSLRTRVYSRLVQRTPIFDESAHNRPPSLIDTALCDPTAVKSPKAVLPFFLSWNGATALTLNRLYCWPAGHHSTSTLTYSFCIAGYTQLLPLCFLRTMLSNPLLYFVACKLFEAFRRPVFTQMTTVA